MKTDKTTVMDSGDNATFEMKLGNDLSFAGRNVEPVTDSRTVASVIFKSGFDGGYWRKFADDRPNEVVGYDELTAEQIKQLDQFCEIKA